MARVADPCGYAPHSFLVIHTFSLCARTMAVFQQTPKDACFLWSAVARHRFSSERLRREVDDLIPVMKRFLTNSQKPFHNWYYTILVLSIEVLFI